MSELPRHAALGVVLVVEKGQLFRPHQLAV
jgi:hypothetical protein